jgi:hypothetical protein
MMKKTGVKKSCWTVPLSYCMKMKNLREKAVSQEKQEDLLGQLPSVSPHISGIFSLYPFIEAS